MSIIDHQYIEPINFGVPICGSSGSDDMSEDYDLEDRFSKSACQEIVQGCSSAHLLTFKPIGDLFDPLACLDPLAPEANEDKAKKIICSEFSLATCTRQFDEKTFEECKRQYGSTKYKEVFRQFERGEKNLLWTSGKEGRACDPEFDEKKSTLYFVDGLYFQDDFAEFFKREKLLIAETECIQLIPGLLNAEKVVLRNPDTNMIVEEECIVSFNVSAGSHEQFEEFCSATQYGGFCAPKKFSRAVQLGVNNKNKY